jgi:polyhydroxyalkanoate synthesis regulator phasin
MEVKMPPKTKPKTEPNTNAETEHSPMYQASRKVLLAAMGAAALAQEELEDFVNRLVERGEIAEKEGSGLLQEMRDRRKKRMQKIETEAGKRLSQLLERMDLPTKKDVDTLSDKIAALSRKVDELNKRQA